MLGMFSNIYATNPYCKPRLEIQEYIIVFINIYNNNVETIKLNLFIGLFYTIVTTDNILGSKLKASAQKTYLREKAVISIYVKKNS